MDQKRAIRDALRREVWPQPWNPYKTSDRPGFFPGTGPSGHEFMAKTGHIGKILLTLD
jgi:hypothetical protein